MSEVTAGSGGDDLGDGGGNGGDGEGYGGGEGCGGVGEGGGGSGGGVVQLIPTWSWSNCSTSFTAVPSVSTAVCMQSP